MPAAVARGGMRVRSIAWLCGRDMAAGRVARWEDVLDENHFAAIQPGMDAHDVLRLIGPPSWTWHYFRPLPANTWLYRFDTIERCTLFEISFDAATGKVLDSDYPPDPGCPEPRG